MKLCSRKIASGRPKIVCATQTAWKVPLMPRLLEKICRSGMSAICSGTICRAKMSTNSEPEPLNLIHAKAYAAIVARAIGNSVAGIETTSELTK